jgi:SAM-dependent methyltransferase
MAERLEMLRLFLAEQRDPLPYHKRLARDTIASLPFELSGSLVVDLGCGPGHYTRAMRAAGAVVFPLDLDPDEFGLPGGPPGGEALASGMAIPLRDRSVDGVLTSNMIEHTPEPTAVIAEIERIVRPGGWIWLSWTNWYSPWGGHDVSPYHYLGPRLGLKVHRAIRHADPKNVPLHSLYPLHVGPTIRMLRSRPRLRILDVAPRYYPSQRWILRIPGLREVVTWNCRVIAQRV